MLDLWRLKCFVIVAETEHIGLASEKLHLSPSPLSRQIRQLEDELNLKLFERVGKRLQINGIGRLFLQEAHALLKHAENVENKARLLASPNSGPLAIGHIQEAMIGGVLPSVLINLNKISPSITPSLLPMSSSSQISELKKGRLDFGLVSGPLYEWKFNSLCLKKEPYIAILPKDHRLKERLEVDFSDLHGETWVGPPMSVWETLRQVFNDAGVLTPKAYQTFDITTSIAMVSAGAGITILQESALRILNQNLLAIPVKEKDFEMELHLIWREDSLTGAGKRFLAAAKALTPLDQGGF